MTHPAAPTPVSRWVGVAVLLSIATTFAANHVAARLAFDHGTSIAAAVVVRSSVAVTTLAALLASTGGPWRVPATVLGRAAIVGLLLSVQSYCLYGAVARLPVALALLTFNVFPLLLAGLSWATGGERPARRTLLAMPVILIGLALALNVLGIGLPAPGTGRAAPAGAAGPVARHWVELASGVGFALTASLAFATALLLTSRWLGSIDGRLRACLTMATVTIVVLTVGLLVQAAGLVQSPNGLPLPVFRFPTAPVGWLGLALLSLLYTIGFSSMFVLLPRLGAVNNTPILNFEPIAALILGAWILDQHVLPVQIGGALLVVAAIIFLATGRSR